jgi:hypothetical protein
VVSASNYRFFWGLLVFLSMGTALFFDCLAVSLFFLALLDRHGSFGGNTLLIGLGLVLLILSIFLLAVGIVNWRKLSQPRSKDANS